MTLLRVLRTQVVCCFENIHVPDCMYIGSRESRRQKIFWKKILRSLKMKETSFLWCVFFGGELWTVFFTRTSIHMYIHHWFVDFRGVDKFAASLQAAWRGQYSFCETAGLTFDEVITRTECLKWMYFEVGGILIYQSITSEIEISGCAAWGNIMMK
jgi:hypothetical protein